MSTLQTARNTFRDLMGWSEADLLVVDFVLSSALSPFLPGAVEKPWGALVGAASTGKSTILTALSKHPRSVEVHRYTENAFSSAYVDPNNPEKDHSLLYELSRDKPPIGPKILINPEMSSVLSKRADIVMSILGDLRTVFDNRYNVHSGMSGRRTYENIQFAYLCASTEVLDDFLKTNQTLGERMLIFRVARHLANYEESRKMSLLVSKTNRVDKAALQAKLAVDMCAALDAGIANAGTTVTTPDGLSERISHLANMAVHTRTCPLKNSFVSTSEGPARLELQLRTLGDCRAILDGRTAIDQSDFKLLQRTSLDTMPPDNFRLLNALWRGSPQESIKPMSRLELASVAKVDPDYTKKQLRQWTIIDFVVQCGDMSYAMKPAVAADAANSIFYAGE